jgi:hypothetical protein
MLKEDLAMIKLAFPRTLEFPPAKRQYETGDLITFSNAWPSQLGILPGHTYKVVWRADVPYDLSYIIGTADYKDVNISDNTQNAPTNPQYENLYPYGTQNTIYQILLGFKPGNYMCHLYMPYDQWILGLEFTNMVPNDANMSNPRLKYIGSIKPEDSPHYDPRLTIVTVYNMVPFYLRYLTDSGVTGDAEKCITNMIINHCQLVDVTAGLPGVNPQGQNVIMPLTQEQKNRNLIRYVTELSFRTRGPV